MAVRHSGVDSFRIRGRNMGMKRKREGREGGGKISKVDLGSRLEDAGIFDKRRITKEQVKR